MKFNDFLEKYKDTQLIDSSTFELLAENPRDTRRQVAYWLKKGYLIALKKGIYVFGENYRKKELSSFFLANFLASPSYLSLEYALGFYDLIPEKVTVFTSVTTKKTQKYNNAFGVFQYRSIKKSLFFGYKRYLENGQPYFIASPEKVFLDYFYLSKGFSGNFEEFESMRFQNLEIINVKKLKSFSFNYNKKTKEILTSFLEFIKQDKKKYKTIK